jgi:hypothetical protein
MKLCTAELLVKVAPLLLLKRSKTFLHPAFVNVLTSLL